MKVLVNGEEKALTGGTTVARLLHDLGIEKNPIAVELNREVVPKDRHGSTELKEGDRLEIVTLVGGG